MDQEAPRGTLMHKQAENQKRYREKNKEKIKLQKQDYYERNREALQQYKKEYYLANK